MLCRREGEAGNIALFDVGTERVPSSDDAETYDMAMGLVASTGVPVVEVSDAEAMAMMPGNKKTPLADQPNRANEKPVSGSVLAAHVGGSSSNANDSRNRDAKLINDTQSAKNKINKYVNGDFDIDTTTLSKAISGIGQISFIVSD